MQISKRESVDFFFAKCQLNIKQFQHLFVGEFFPLIITWAFKKNCPAFLPCASRLPEGIRLCGKETPGHLRKKLQSRGKVKGMSCMAPSNGAREDLLCKALQVKQGKKVCKVTEVQCNQSLSLCLLLFLAGRAKRLKSYKGQLLTAAGPL